MEEKIKQLPQFSAVATPELSPLAIRSIGPFSTLLFLGLLDFEWAHFGGYDFNGGYWSYVAIVILTGISVVYGSNERSRFVSDMAYFGSLWACYVCVGKVFSYMAATLQRPLLDNDFTRLDAALGFHWLDWFNYLTMRPLFSFVLLLAYYSLLPQIFASIIYFSYNKKIDKNEELWWSAVISLLFTVALSGLFPAAGTFHHFGVGLSNAVHLPHFFALRDGSVKVFEMGQMEGIITFPSYHTVMAILLMYVYRGQRFWFVAVGVLNVLMLLSTPSFGGHYLVDMISGGLVAVLTIYFVRHIPLISRSLPLRGVRY